MSIGEWVMLIFVGGFLLLMLVGVVAWLAQLVRRHRHRHHQPPNRKR